MKTGLKSKIIFVMGVSGCGKSTVGKLLAKEFKVDFFDADDYHPLENIEKMSKGIALTDIDREPWLNRLNQVAQNNLNDGCVIACSALKKKYRETLVKDISTHVDWVFLKGSYDLIFSRMKERGNHFMTPKMLKSQFEALEEPKEVIVVNIEDSTEEIVGKLSPLIKNFT